MTKRVYVHMPTQEMRLALIQLLLKKVDSKISKRELDGIAR